MENKNKIEYDDIVRETSITCVTTIVFAVDMNRSFSNFRLIYYALHGAVSQELLTVICSISILISSAKIISFGDNL